MLRNAQEYTQKCDPCQRNRALIHALVEKLHSVSTRQPLYDILSVGILILYLVKKQRHKLTMVTGEGRRPKRDVVTK